DHVYMVGMEEGRFPLQRAVVEPAELEEERRLFYVGMTRARRSVHLSLASIRFQFGEVESVPSRFVREIPPDLVDTDDRRTAQRYSQAAATTVAPSLRRAGRTTGITDTYYEYEGSEMMRPGSIVEHPTFGRGTITAVEGFGDSLRLEIMFSGLGLKKIMARYARLKVIG
ncbi:MAG: hypothetical protein JSU65_11240, partial [Candidatus Zixiibacteriota bacterium]